MSFEVRRHGGREGEYREPGPGGNLRQEIYRRGIPQKLSIFLMFLKKIPEQIDCKFCEGFTATLSYRQESLDIFGEKLMEDFREHAWWNHWYAKHYNCAYCGQWIPPYERDLLISKGQSFEIHPEYNKDERSELLRLHTGCTEKLPS